MLGERLKSLRQEYKITQEELAKNVGVTTSMIGMYETNARKPSYEVLLKIADYFNTTADYLLGNSNMRVPEETLKKWDNKYNKDGELEKQVRFIESLKLDSPEKALKFILQQPNFMAYGGYNLDDLSEEELMDLANDMLLAMRLSIEKKKKKQ